MILSDEPAVRVMGGRGFQLRFENGCTASVMFSINNDCQHKGGMPGDPRLHASEDAEVCAYDAAGRVISGVAGCGFVSPDAIGRFIEAVRLHVPGTVFRFSR